MDTCNMSRPEFLVHGQFGSSECQEISQIILDIFLQEIQLVPHSE